MTIPVELPGEKSLELEHLLLDVNGTLTLDGRLLDGVGSAVARVAEGLSVHLLSADTFGTGHAVARELGVGLEIVTDGAHKRALVEQLGAGRCVAVGNGRNDVAMLRAAALGIAVIGPEGGSADAVAAADLVSISVLAPSPKSVRWRLQDFCTYGVLRPIHPSWGRPIAQTAGTGRRSSTSTLSTENPPSRSRSASSFPRSRARSGAEWRASQKR